MVSFYTQATQTYGNIKVGDVVTKEKMNQTKLAVCIGRTGLHNPRLSSNLCIAVLFYCEDFRLDLHSF